MPSVDSTSTHVIVIPSHMGPNGTWTVSDLAHIPQIRQQSRETATTDGLPYAVTDAIPLATLFGKADAPARAAQEPGTAGIVAHVETSTDRPADGPNGHTVNGQSHHSKVEAAPPGNVTLENSAPVALPPPMVPRTRSLPVVTEDGCPQTSTDEATLAHSDDNKSSPELEAEAASTNPAPPVPAVPRTETPATGDAGAVSPSDRPHIATSRLADLIAGQKLVLDQLAQATSRLEPETAPTETPEAGSPSVELQPAPAALSQTATNRSAPPVEIGDEEIVIAPSSAEPSENDAPLPPAPPTGQARLYEVAVPVVPPVKASPSEEAQAEQSDEPLLTLASLDDLARAFAKPMPVAEPAEPVVTSSTSTSLVTAPPPAVAELLQQPVTPQRTELVTIETTGEWIAPSRLPGLSFGLALSMVIGAALWIALLR